MRMAVVGSGGWGTALAVMLAKNGNDVDLWSYSHNEYETLQSNRENPMFLPGVMFPERGLIALLIYA